MDPLAIISGFSGIAPKTRKSMAKGTKKVKQKHGSKPQQLQPAKASLPLLSKENPTATLTGNVPDELLLLDLSDDDDNRNGSTEHTTVERIGGKVF